MARAGYRQDQRQVQVWLDPDLLDRVDRKAGRHGTSRQQAVVEALRGWLGEEVGDDGDADGRSGPRRGLSAVADVGGPRPVAGVGREDRPRVGAGDVADPLSAPLGNVPAFGEGTGFVNLGGNPKLDALNAGMERVMAEKAAARSALVGAVEPSLFESVPPWDKAVGDDVDPWDTPLPAPTDTRGRILSPVVRDEFIDLP